MDHEGWISHHLAADPEVEARFAEVRPEEVAHLLDLSGPAEVFESVENRVFGWNDAVLKLFRPGRWSRAAIDDERVFLQDLAGVGVGVAAPLAVGTWQGVHWMAYEHVDAVPIIEPDRDTLVALGRSAALVHTIGATRGAPHRPEVIAAPFVGGCAAVANQRLNRDDYADVTAELVDRCGPVDALPRHRVHFDMGLWNCLRGPVWLDFDDFCMAPALHDLHVLCLGLDPDGVAAVLEGYREIRAFPEDWWRLRPLVRAQRLVWFDAWYAARWHDPVLLADEPELHSAAFWDARIADLRASLG